MKNRNNVVFYHRSLKEEIEEKRHIITKEKSDLSSLSEKHQTIRDKIESLNTEMNNYRNTISLANRKISELKQVIDLEAPSLQTKFEELASLETEIAELEEKKKVSVGFYLHRFENECRLIEFFPPKNRKLRKNRKSSERKCRRLKNSWINVASVIQLSNKVN